MTAVPGELWGALVAPPAVLEAAGDAAWVRAMLDAEAALALACADAGLVAPDDARAVAEACGAPLDPGALGAAGRATGTPVMALLEGVRRRLPERARPALHLGATSQDIMDTAAALVARRALEVVLAELRRAGDGAAGLARRHAGDVMAARTLLRQAAPTTFGLKAAGWLTGLSDARDQLRHAAAGLTAQLGGPVGTLARLGESGPAVAAAYADRLGLPDQGVPWQTARQRVAAVGAALAIGAATGAKITGDVALLGQDEVAEVAVDGAARGGSSSMPHKRNPAGAVAAASAARRAAALVPVLIGAVVVEHERGVGGWQAEWAALSDLLVAAGAALAAAADDLGSLRVDTAAMAAAVAAAGGRLLSDRVEAALAGAVGDTAARAALARASRDGGPSGFAARLHADPDVAAAGIDVDALLDPAGWLGQTPTWIERACRRWAEG